MILLNLKGGLGNQVFQFIAALKYAKIYNKKLYIYIGNLENYSVKRDFNLELIIPDLSFDIRLIDKKYFFLHKYILAILAKCKIFIIDECNYPKKYPFFNILDSYFLERKFMDNEILSQIRKVVSEKCNHSTEKIISSINNINSIGIHIRGGDRKSESVLINYQNILNNILDFQKSYTIFCFTDDIKFARERLCENINNIVFIQDFGLNTLEEFYLISQFKNFIAPNSTYSVLARYFSHSDCHTYLIESMFDIRDKELKELFINHKNIQFV